MKRKTMHQIWRVTIGIILCVGFDVTPVSIAAGSATQRLAVLLQPAAKWQGQMKREYRVVDLPKPVVGARWVRVAAIEDPDFQNGFSVMLLDSAGRLASTGGLATIQREHIEALFPGERFVDFSVNQRPTIGPPGYINGISYLLTADGRIINALSARAGIFNDQQTTAEQLLHSARRNRLPKLPAGVTYTRMLGGPDVVARSDGRVVVSRAIHGCDDNYCGEVRPGRTAYVTKGVGSVAAASTVYDLPARRGIASYSKYDDRSTGNAVIIIRANGTAATKLVSTPNYVGENDKPPTWNKRNVATQIKNRGLGKPPSGVKYIDATNAGAGLAVLRSDGKIAYRGLTQYKTDPPQPPKLPRKLRYTGIHYQQASWHAADYWGEYELSAKLTLERSDGILVALHCASHKNGLMSKCSWSRLNGLPSNWQPVPELTRNSLVDAYVIEPKTTAAVASVKAKPAAWDVLTARWPTVGCGTSAPLGLTAVTQRFNRHRDHRKHHYCNDHQVNVVTHPRVFAA
jgi:hypothetical protein